MKLSKSEPLSNSPTTTFKGTAQLLPPSINSGQSLTVGVPGHTVKRGVRDWEGGSVLKCFLYKFGYLSVDPQHLHKGQVWWHVSVALKLNDAESCGSWRLPGQEA